MPQSERYTLLQAPKTYTEYFGGSNFTQCLCPTGKHSLAPLLLYEQPLGRRAAATALRPIE